MTTMTTALLAASVLVGITMADTAVTDVTVEWSLSNMVENTSQLKICAQHTNALTSQVSNTITYTLGTGYSRDTATTTLNTDYEWGAASTIAAIDESSFWAICDQAANVITCNYLTVNAGEFSCLTLLLATHTLETLTLAEFTVASFADVTPVAAVGAADFGTPFTAFALSKPNADNAWVGADVFVFTATITPSSDLAIGDTLVINLPGYTFKAGSVCSWGTVAATDGSDISIDSDDIADYVLTAASGTASVELKCTQIQAKTVTAAGRMWMIAGTTTAQGSGATLLALAASAPVTTTSSAALASLSVAAVIVVASLM